MATYLGETPVDVTQHPKYSKYTPTDWAMLFISRYGQIEGDHHRAWVLDQVSQILKGTQVQVSLASWDNGESEYRYELGEPSQAYKDWVEAMLERDEHGEPQYDYDPGIAP